MILTPFCKNSIFLREQLQSLMAGEKNFLPSSETWSRANSYPYRESRGRAFTFPSLKLVILWPFRSSFGPDFSSNGRSGTYDLFLSRLTRNVHRLRLSRTVRCHRRVANFRKSL